jgi:ferredoxin--NADP+ reductase
MFKITRKQSLCDDIFLLEFELAAVAERARPGQYVDIHLHPDARPITVPVTDADVDAGTFSIVEQGRDLPTEQLMVLSPGEEVFQIRGPLGSACEFNVDGKVVLMGEDLGVGSLLWRAREHRAAGAYVIVILDSHPKTASSGRMNSAKWPTSSTSQRWTVPSASRDAQPARCRRCARHKRISIAS